MRLGKRRGSHGRHSFTAFLPLFPGQPAALCEDVWHLARRGHHGVAEWWGQKPVHLDLPGVGGRGGDSPKYLCLLCHLHFIFKECPSLLPSRWAEKIYLLRKSPRDFPGGAEVKNPPANAGDTGPIPGPGRSHMPRSN